MQPRHVVDRPQICVMAQRFAYFARNSALCCGVFQAQTDTANSALNALQADQAANDGAGIGVSTDWTTDDA